MCMHTILSLWQQTANDGPLTDGMSSDDGVVFSFLPVAPRMAAAKPLA